MNILLKHSIYKYNDYKYLLIEFIKLYNTSSNNFYKKCTFD